MTQYDRAFFNSQQVDSLASARGVLPTILDAIGPSSLLDVGCGVGTWLKAASELGVRDLLGIDGDYVDRSMLHISKDRFRPFDLSKPFDLGRRFDLAMSLEVAEHLPSASAEGFVQSLVNAAPAVLMSAATPGQGGLDHVNERWQDYWAGLFQAKGYDVFDIVRPAMWNRSDVQWFYAQNVLLYVEKSRVAHFPKLDRKGPESSAMPLRVVHPKLYAQLYCYTHGDNVSIRRAASQLGRSTIRSIRRRLGWSMEPTLLNT
jgi:SAM-dependent methyltransferase